MNRPKVLLVNPHIEDFAAYDHYSKPLGLLWLASYLHPYCDIAFVNALNRLCPQAPVAVKPDGTGNFFYEVIPTPPVINDIPRKFKRFGLPGEIFQQELRRLPFVPEWVFLTTAMTYWYTGVQYTVRLVREVFPRARIILGGVYASLLPEHARTVTKAHSVISQQNIRKTLTEISGLWAQEIVYPGYLPPAYNLLGEYYYAPLLTSTGCPFRCSYCAGPYLNCFEQFPPEQISQNIVYLSRNYGVTNFAFYDDALLVHAGKHLQVILENVLKENIEARFYTPNGLHIRYLDKDTAKLMKEAGFVDIRLSLESSDHDFHVRKDRKTGLEEFERAVAVLREAGFSQQEIQVYTLLNVPGQDDGSVEQTMRYIHRQGATPRLAFYSPIPHTPDFDRACRKTDLSDPLSHNNTVYLYRSGFDQDYWQHLKKLELEYRHSSGEFIM